jgi:hypothetical protein
MPTLSSKDKKGQKTKDKTTTDKTTKRKGRSTNNAHIVVKRGTKPEQYTSHTNVTSSSWRA